MRCSERKTKEHDLHYLLSMNKNQVSGFGIVFLIFVICGQILASFLVIKISVEPQALPQPYATLVVTSGATTSSLSTGKQWHTVAIWTLSVVAMAFGSSNYLVLLRNKEQDDLDMFGKEEFQRLKTKLGKWRRKARKLFQGISCICFLRKVSMRLRDMETLRQASLKLFALAKLL